jgi:hypothetical protein
MKVVIIVGFVLGFVAGYTVGNTGLNHVYGEFPVQYLYEED